MVFRRGIEGSRGFVEQKQRRIADDCPGDGKQLFLSLGELVDGTGNVSESHECQCVSAGAFGDRRIVETDLVDDAAFHRYEILIDISVDTSF